MWQDLAVAHRKSGTPAPELRGEGPRWKTCLRDLLFAPPGCLPSGGELRRGLDAHRFLVEICSGLHSPLFGETEVFGQFRAFRAAQDWHPAWSELLDAVEEDVRKVRRTHLVDIGSQSYGSLARRHLPAGEPVVLVGAGRLALDLLPWLGERPVTVAVRDPAKVSFAHAVSLEALPEATPAHWLIAAPVANEQLTGWWARRPARLVLDFRGEYSFEGTPPGCERYLALATLYAELESVRELHARKRAEALAYAAGLSRRRAEAVVHRPYGWEDAFA
jgi:glutamyl-tRNA reductase